METIVYFDLLGHQVNRNEFGSEGGGGGGGGCTGGLVGTGGLLKTF